LHDESDDAYHMLPIGRSILETYETINID